MARTTWARLRVQRNSLHSSLHTNRCRLAAETYYSALRNLCFVRRHTICCRRYSKEDHCSGYSRKLCFSAVYYSCHRYDFPINLQWYVFDTSPFFDGSTIPFLGYVMYIAVMLLLHLFIKIIVLALGFIVCSSVLQSYDITSEQNTIYLLSANRNWPSSIKPILAE